MKIDSFLPHASKAIGLVCLSFMLIGSYIVGRASRIEINLGDINLYVTTSDAKATLQNIDDQVKSHELPPSPNEINKRIKIIPSAKGEKNEKNH